MFIFYIKYNLTDIYKNYLYSVNKDFYKVIDKLKNDTIRVDYIPDELKNYMKCINIPNIQKNPKMILDEFVKNNIELQKIYNDLFIFDPLDFSGSYFPSAHTDIEWNKIKNGGFQVWSLIENDQETGNMFILYNKHLFNKYKNTSIFLRMYKDKIAVIKNCYNSEFLWYIKKDYIYELISIDDFIKNTKKYYLDFKSGDTMMFAKNVIHMSDYRSSANNRKAFNFRVAIADNNRLLISKSKCGYVNSLKNL